MRITKSSELNVKPRYKQLVIRSNYSCVLVKFRLVIIGIVIVLLAVPAYIMLPFLLTQEMYKLTGGNSASALSNQIFSQLGIPPIDTMIAFMKYLFVGLIIAGLGMISFGVISRKMAKQSPLKVNIEPNLRLHVGEDSNLKALDTLQERLSKGEITPSQFQNLKKKLEGNI